MNTNKLQASPLTMHGVFVDVLGLGVLLTGVSGIGKSELALGLIDRGHCLIADDCVLLSVNDNQKLIGKCPPVLQDFLEVRGLGLLNIRAMFGDGAIREHKRLQLIVNVINISNEELPHIDRLHGMHRMRDILGCEIPEVSIPVAPGRNLSILVEGAVRNQILKNNGFDATKEFMKRQDAKLKRSQQQQTDAQQSNTQQSNATVANEQQPGEQNPSEQQDGK